jgi:hypothetical protein
MQSSWSTVRDQRIFYCNFTNLSEDAFEAEIHETERIISQQPANSVRELTDLRGLALTRRVTDLLRRSAARKKPYVLIEAVVVSDFTGAKRVLLEVISRISGQPFTVFESVDAAERWLSRMED